MSAVKKILCNQMFLGTFLLAVASTSITIILYQKHKDEVFAETFHDRHDWFLLFQSQTSTNGFGGESQRTDRHEFVDFQTCWATRRAYHDAGFKSAECYRVTDGLNIRQIRKQKH